MMSGCLLLILLVLFMIHLNIEYVESTNVENYESKPCTCLSKYIKCFDVTEQHAGYNINGTPSERPDTTTGSGPRMQGLLDHLAKPENEPTTLAINFNAFDRTFKIVLHVAQESDMDIVRSSAKVNIIGFNKNETSTLGDLSRGSSGFYCKGYVQGEPSKVHGKCQGGRFTGVIHLREATFFIEHATSYGQAMQNQRPDQYVVYRRKDILYYKVKAHGRLKNPPGAWSLDQNMLDSHVLEKYTNTTFWSPDQERFRSSSISSESKLCELHVLADHTFYTHFHGHTSTVLSEMVYHIAEADNLFRYTDFDADGIGDNIGFVVREYTIFTDKYVSGYKFADETVDDDTLLNQLSALDFSDSCLAILFTYRDFEGVVGTAFLSSTSPSNRAGLCAPRIYFSNPPDHPAGYYSFNTLLVTKLSYGHTVPRDVVSLIVAHELGHAFGAQHDNPHTQICSPDTSSGKYLMHKYSSSAEKPNNWIFSPCSREWIGPVIEEKGSCLIINSGPYCGNGRLEVGELCDCGADDLCQVTDYCCVSHADSAYACTFGADTNKVCSTLQSACCSETCEPVPMSSHKECRKATECTEASVCNGVDVECPSPQLVADGTSCNEGAGVCTNGECTTSICEHYDLVTCQCTDHNVNLCKICCGCKVYTQETCVAADWLDILDLNGHVLYRPAGSSCNNYKGYCDSHRDCLLSPMDTELVQNPEINSNVVEYQVYKWLSQYWYLLILGFAGVLLVIGITYLTKSRYNRVNNINHLTATYNQAQNQHEQLESLEGRLENICEGRQSATEDSECVVEQSVAITRLRTFLPTTPQHVLVETVHGCQTEQQAVGELLRQGYVLRQLYDATQSQ